MYTKVNYKDKEYELKLIARRAVDFEEELGQNPLFLFCEGIPKLKDLLLLFKYCFPEEVDVDVYDFYDEWSSNGHSFNELVKVGVEIYKSSGFLKKPEENDSKN